MRAVLLALLGILLSVTAKDFYRILAVKRNAELSEIKKAYKKLSRQHHPDKNNGNSDKFVEIGLAYDALSDPAKRKIYDQHGEEGLQRHAQNGGQDPFDIFNRFNGGAAGRNRGPNIHTEVEVDLPSIYNGKSFDITIPRHELCPHCHGSGAHHPDDVHTCPICQGSGVQIIRQQVMPGMFTNMQHQCQHCHGRGKHIERICGRCGGARIVEAQHSLTINIDKGLPEGQEIVFDGESNQSPDQEAGDILVKVKTKRLPGGYRREGDQLYWVETITLEEALLGFRRNLIAMDGRRIRLERTGVTQPGTVEMHSDEGMPRWEDSGHGDLWVEYKVALPDSVSAATISVLQNLIKLANKGGSNKIDL